jgi:ribosomal protein S18 acetylase RimI-like enzyme
MIRKATLEDLESILEIEKTFGAEAFTRRSLRYHIVNQKTLVIDDNGVRGYSIVLARKGSAKARLYSIAIAEPYRGYGYGQALLKASESFAISSFGAIGMTLEVAESNRVARRFYSDFGYFEVKRIENYYQNGDRAYRLWRAF